MRRAEHYLPLICRAIVTAVLLCCLSVHAGDFRIARPDDSPNATMLEIERRVVEAYRHIGITAVVLGLPALRSAAYAKQDLVDAELLRVDVPERNNDFIRVDVPLITFDVVAVGHRNLKPIEQPSSLKGLRVGVLRGVLALLHTARSAYAIEQAPDYKSLNRMLEEGHVDVALMLTSNYPQFQAAHHDDWAAHQVDVLNPHLASYKAFHYLSPRHAALVPTLVPALRAAGLPLPSTLSTERPKSADVGPGSR